MQSPSLARIRNSTRFKVESIDTYNIPAILELILVRVFVRVTNVVDREYVRTFETGYA
jgi:hypothetical protein